MKTTYEIEVEAEQVRMAAAKAISRLEVMKSADHETYKNVVSRLARAAGKPLEKEPETWSFLLKTVPGFMKDESGEPTMEEEAVYGMLTLYAIGRSQPDPAVLSYQEDWNIGRSLKTGGYSSGKGRDIDRLLDKICAYPRFPYVLTALTHAFKVVEAGGGHMPVNFPMLAADFYRIRTGRSGEVCFRWATAYHSYQKTAKNAETISSEEDA